MKRLLAILIITVILFSFSGCGRTRVPKGADVTLTFVYEEKEIHVTLDDDEAERVIVILDGNSYAPVASGIPSCGFSMNVSLSVGGQIFAIACDTCNCIQDFGKLRYFDIPQEDMEYIHSLFEKHGGCFPCI